MVIISIWKNKGLLCLKYWYVNKLYDWALSQKLPVNEFDESFIKNCNEESDEGQFYEFDVKYPEKLHNLYDFYQKE